MTARTCAIVLNYRKAQKTAACLDSLAGQGLDTVYVIDNSNDTASSRELRETLKRFDEDSPGYRLVCLTPDANLGFAGGVNYAIEKDRSNGAAHERYLLINNDATAMPGMLDKLQQALQTDERICMSAPSIISRDGTVEEGLWYNRYLGTLGHRPAPLSFRYASGCCMLINATSLQDGRLFDPAFFMYCEDAFLCWRLQQAGMEFRIIPEARIQHEEGASSQKAGLFYEYQTARGHILMAFRAYRQPLEVPLMLACRLVTLSLRSLSRCIRYRSPVPALALLLAWYPPALRLN